MSTGHPAKVSTRSTLRSIRRKILVVKQTHALAALIDDVRAANGWSDPDVVTRAASKGHKLSKSNISRIRNNPVVTLNIETVSALADGLGVPKAMVANAALASMGIVTYSSADLTAEEAIRRDPTLSERDKKMLLTVLLGLRDATAGTGQESGRHDDPSTAQLRRERNEFVHGLWKDSGRGHVGLGQKTEQVDDEDALAVKRKTGARGHKAGLRAADYPDNNIPLPDDYDQLAAHPSTDSSGRREHAAGHERGEESQEVHDE